MRRYTLHTVLILKDVSLAELEPLDNWTCWAIVHAHCIQEWLDEYPDEV